MYSDVESVLCVFVRICGYTNSNAGCNPKEGEIAIAKNMDHENGSWHYVGVLGNYSLTTRDVRPNVGITCF